MKKYFVTFGLGTNWRRKYVVVYADTGDEVRNYVFSKYGQDNVAWIYDYKTAKSIIKAYGYEKIEEVRLNGKVINVGAV